MQKISTMRTSGKNIFKGQLTIGLDLGDRSSAYCVLNETGLDPEVSPFVGPPSLTCLRAQPKMSAKCRIPHL